MNQPTTHSAFAWLRSSRIPSLNVEVQEFRHKVTGAPHIHIAADDDQNAFLVGFRTVPQDSTGVAHILEHTTLCGSRRYPVRDPFFMMTRRSLNTFMNAFTASDWTAYPFASCNRKDFYNLLQVYLDAVFFPTLDPLDFAQEGHRVEFAEPTNPDSPLVFKGVVFNEMKGAMSAPTSALYQYLTKHLFPTITYHHNPGGDPEHIPDLTYDQLKNFHARHYHPSNALFMTYGDIPAHEHQLYFEEYALKEFNRLDVNIQVPDERRYDAPRTATERYALDGEEDTADKTHIVLGWLLGNGTDPETLLTAHLLSDVLLDNSASPLRQVLETSDLGSAPSPLCGLSDSTREMFFAAGLEGSNPEHAAAVEQLILDTLRRVADEGVPQEQVEAMLHQLELSQREVSGDGFPYGLQLMVHALAPALHGADPVAVLDIDPILNRLRERIADPDFIKAEVRKLLTNPHRVCLIMRPDTNLSAERAARETARLAALKEKLGSAEKQRIVEQAAALAARQAQQDDPEVLPKVSLDDVPTDLHVPQGETAPVAAMPATWYTRGTNGLVYQELVVDLPELEPDLANLLPMFCNIVTEVGSGGRDYLATQELQAAVTGGLSARATVRGSIDDANQGRGVFVLSGKALARNHAALSDLLRETFDSARFDELERLRELVAQERLQQEQSVTGSGHGLAMMAAAAGLSPSAALSHRWYGLAGIKALKHLDDALDDPVALQAFADRLQRLRNALLAAPRQFLLIGEEEQRSGYTAALAARWADAAAVQDTTRFALPASNEARNQGWTTSTQVNFCAKAYAAVPMEHDDGAALMVLGGFLRNNYLHRAIREQGGAYGGGAGYDPDSAAFRFYSYRDPRLAETLADFDASIRWLLDNDHAWRLVEEAILGVIASIDKPGSPAGEVKKTFHAALHGRTPEQRRRFRARVLGVTQDDLKRVAATYLKPETASTAVISNPATLKQAGLGLEVIAL
ncbi:insulinase family protein [Sulfurivermis fontis]|uniref:insulinase family protein n=1 Tax=Sulfurivermis fontis TaxID=1972068 RepID=UPI000FDC55B4|nr:insulinase family protein [Sulfurivermis fontis]